MVQLSKTLTRMCSHVLSEVTTPRKLDSTEFAFYFETVVSLMLLQVSKQRKLLSTETTDVRVFLWL